MNDEELIPLLAQGSEPAWRLVYARQQARLYRFALHMTGSPGLAEDVVQETFVAFMDGLGRYRAANGTLGGYLLGIARRQALRARGLREWPAALEATGEEPCDAPDPFDQVVAGSDLAALREEIDRLPAAYREAVVLCELEELSYQEAAQAMDCPVGTVRSRLARGRALLGDALAVRMGKAVRHV